MKCDMCGSEGKLYKATIEDARLNVCHECSKFGKVTGIVPQISDNKPKKVASEELEVEVMEMVVSDYAEKIRGKRGHLGLKQEEFAKKINEKESLLQKIESGRFEPSIALAKKIGNFLRINLVEEYKETHGKHAKSKTGSFTIGDFIKIMKNHPK
jgi:putative transcription factor|tara:strand:+ start:5778 stop:6242 length:465 start_codon:yes stop_codon:yes gene_type:complete